jgi:eukaryotic-like serine/threonine-protein kinase
MPLIQGQFLQNNRYRIDAMLAEGGMALIYRGWDTNLSLPVAIKENLDIAPEVQRQFMREATILARLSHPNLPRVLDYFVIPDEGQYLVMDYVEGEDLDAMLYRLGPLPEAQVLTWMIEVCNALSYLHSQPSPVIHRDIKPANIKIRPDLRAMLVDFGIAKLFNAEMATTLGARAVTPGFSPPEQYGGSRTDARSDIYALGATLYHLLTGKTPPESIRRMIRQAELIPPRQVNPAISPQTEQVILRATELDAQHRFQTVQEMRAALYPTNVPPQASSPAGAEAPKPVIVSPSQPALAAAQRAASSRPRSSRPRPKPAPAWRQILIYFLIGIGLVSLCLLSMILLYSSQL